MKKFLKNQQKRRLFNFFYYFCKIKNFSQKIHKQLKTKGLHIRFFTFCLLLSMLKVAFPIGELFHEHHHHSAEEECTHSTGKTCKHTAHFSEEHSHSADCIFVQLHTFFVQPTFLYPFFGEKYTLFSFFKEENILHTEIQTSSRAPPFVVFFQIV